MLADFPGSFEKENPSDVSSSNPEPVSQNLLKGVKWTSVFRETEFWFPGKFIHIMRYPDIPEHPCPQPVVRKGEEQVGGAPGMSQAPFHFRSSTERPPAARRPPPREAEALQRL